MVSSDSVVMRVRFAERGAMRNIIMPATLDNTADSAVWFGLEKFEARG
jgi:hypothetical protein